MQARRLIKELTEMIDKNPKLAYAKVCVDTEWAKGGNQYKYYEVNEINRASCLFDIGEYVEQPNERMVIVIGAY